MQSFIEIAPDIYRLRVPFEDIYTSVFAVRTAHGDALIDSATTVSDVETIICPAIAKLGLKPAWILLSHSHGDHAGGVPALAARFPNAQIGLADEKWALAHPTLPTHLLRDGESVLQTLKFFHLPGHAPDASGIWDERSRSLISGDCVQLNGVGRYGTGICDCGAYLHTLDRIRAFAPDRLIPSHSYVPLGDIAVGKPAIDHYLDESHASIQRIAAFIRSIPDDSAAAAAYCAAHPELPPISAGNVRAIRAIQ